MSSTVKWALSITQVHGNRAPREILVLQQEFILSSLSLSPPIFPVPTFPPVSQQWEALSDLNALVCCMSQKQVTKPSDKFTWATDSSLLVLVNKMFKIGLDLLSL